MSDLWCVSWSVRVGPVTMCVLRLRGYTGDTVKFEYNAFNAGKHFASGRNAWCCKCQKIGDSSWPPSFVMTNDGFYCDTCMFPNVSRPSEAMPSD